MKVMRQLFRILDSIGDIINEPIMAPLVDDYARIEDGETMGTYKLAVPGHSRDDINLKLKKNRLFIYIDDELERTLTLTSSIDEKSIDATVKNGILQINFEQDFGSDAKEIEIT